MWWVRGLRAVDISVQVADPSASTASPAHPAMTVPSSVKVTVPEIGGVFPWLSAITVARYVVLDCSWLRVVDPSTRRRVGIGSTRTVTVAEPGW